MINMLARLWRLLTHPPLPPDPTPHPLFLEFYCQACGQAFSQRVPRLYLDLAAARRHQGRQQPVLAPDEVLIPEPIVCPHCGVTDQFEIAASAYQALGAALLRARLGLARPDEPIQFTNIAPPQANPPPAGRSKRRPPRQKGSKRWKS